MLYCWTTSPGTLGNVKGKIAVELKPGMMPMDNSLMNILTHPGVNVTPNAKNRYQKTVF